MLRQLTPDIKSDVSFFFCKRSLRAVTKNAERRLEFDVIHRNYEYSLKASTFPITGKKSNQSSVSDADREFPTLGSTDNAGNSVTSLPALFVDSLVWISRSASETDDKFCLSQSNHY